LQDGTDPRVIELFETAMADRRGAGAEIVDEFKVRGFEKFPRPPQTAAQYKADWERFFAYEGPHFPVKTVAELRDAPAGKGVHALHAARVAEVAAVTRHPMKIRRPSRAARTNRCIARRSALRWTSIVSTPWCFRSGHFR